MKILVNARFLSQPITGVQRYAIECSRKIKKIWPETRFLCPKNVWNKDVFRELGAEVVGSNTGQLWEQFDLKRIADNNGKLPLFNPCNTAPVLYSNNFTTIHDLAFYHHPEWNSRKFATWYNFIIPRIAQRSKHIFTVSNTIASELATHYQLPQQKISVTYNGISDIMLQGSTSTAESKIPIILCVGTFNPRKNQGALVDGFLNSTLRSTHQLILVGDKNRNFADGPGNESAWNDKHIRILSGITESELADQYRQAEIVVSTSLYEGFGIPLLEGLANGCKLLCSDIPVYRELYGTVATFCNPMSVESIAAGLETASRSMLPKPELVLPLLSAYSYDHAADVITGAIAAAS
ncbi:MAG: glycosyltransferase family 4 protein [Taibaiella sp.]|nr:glycosyltransferase family 4 protein [Taibaiella sp.]